MPAPCLSSRAEDPSKSVSSFSYANGVGIRVIIGGDGACECSKLANDTAGEGTKKGVCRAARSGACAWWAPSSRWARCAAPLKPPRRYRVAKRPQAEPRALASRHSKAVAACFAYRLLPARSTGMSSGIERGRAPTGKAWAPPPIGGAHAGGRLRATPTSPPPLAAQLTNAGLWLE